MDRNSPYWNWLMKEANLGMTDPATFTCRYGADASAVMTERELFLAAQAGLYEPGMPVNTVNTRAAKALGIIPKDIEYRGCPRGSRRR